MDFFRGFDLVLNGLDNLEARRHVNRLCLAAETPLVESGTTGYLGQVGSQRGCGMCWVWQNVRLCAWQLRALWLSPGQQGTWGRWAVSMAVACAGCGKMVGQSFDL